MEILPFFNKKQLLLLQKEQLDLEKMFIKLIILPGLVKEKLKLEVFLG
jgi:hypothetical protein